MYLHVGWNEIVQDKTILAVCDYNSWCESDINQQMLEMARVAGTLRYVGDSKNESKNKIRSVVICDNEVILSPITSSTLQRRVLKSEAPGTGK